MSVEPVPCNGCGQRPEFHIGRPPAASVTLEHVENQCDGRSIAIAQASGAGDERDALADRWNALFVPGYNAGVS